MKKAVVTKTYTPENSAQMIKAITEVYDRFSIPVENAFCKLAQMFSAEDAKDGLGLLEFVTNEKGDLGFWVPVGQETWDVAVPTNYYSNAFMPAVAFGAGLTIVAVNHLAWTLDSQGRDKEAAEYSRMYDHLRDFIFDLSERNGDFMDGVAVAGFID